MSLTSEVCSIPRLKAIKFAQEIIKFKCTASFASKVKGLGALFGPDQNGYPDLSNESTGKVKRRFLMS